MTEDNTAAQAALSAQLDPTNARNGAAGIIEDVMQDRRLSRVEARARAQARLTKRSTATLGLHYQTYDKNTHPSGTVVANLVSPTSLNDTLTVQEVSLTFQDANPPIFPLRDVQAAPDLFTFEQVVS